MDIAKEIVLLRAKKGWTQKEMAEELETSQRSVAAWESGESVPRNAMLVKIANLFDLKDDYFFQDERTDSSRDQNNTGTEKLMARFQECIDDSGLGLTGGQQKQLMDEFQRIINNK